jgi:hypothetical protein
MLVHELGRWTRAGWWGEQLSQTISIRTQADRPSTGRQNCTKTADLGAASSAVAMNSIRINFRANSGQVAMYCAGPD